MGPNDPKEGAVTSLEVNGAEGYQEKLHRISTNPHNHPKVKYQYPHCADQRSYKARQVHTAKKSEKE